MADERPSGPPATLGLTTGPALPLQSAEEPRSVHWSQVPNVGMTDGGQCVISAPPDGGLCTPIFVGMSECRFSSGACFSFAVDYPKEERMALPAGFPPPVAKSVKAPKAALPAPDMAEAPTLEIPSLPAAIPSAPAVTGLPGAVGVPAGGAFGELGQLPAAGNISPLTIVLALVAVGGGGAAWKFYSQRSREKHEEQMLKIEKGDSGNDQQRQKCDAAAQWAKERVENLAARADASDKNLAAIADSIDKRIGAMEQKLSDLDSVESRLSVLERKAGAEKKAQKPKGGAK